VISCPGQLSDRFGGQVSGGFRADPSFLHDISTINSQPSTCRLTFTGGYVLPAYSTAVAADNAIAVFGAMSFWWMGEHGTPRIDTSEHVFFANDQLAIRFIEEIDFDYAATDATAALLTAAS